MTGDEAVFHVGVTPLPYTVEYESGLAGIRPSMTAAAELVVRAPPAATPADVETALDDRRAWLLDSLYGLAERRDRLPARSFESGDGLLYGGRRRPLRVAESPVDEPQLRFDGSRFALRIPREGTDASARSRAVVDWYVAHAGDVLSTCAAQLADDRPAPDVRAADLDRRWAQVTADGRIDLHWRLVLAPRPITAYVVAHTLVGRERDPADPAFWTAVEALVPNARASGRWLRRNGGRLRI